MSVNTVNTVNSGNVEPFYYHREYRNDIPEAEQTVEKTWLQEAQRVGFIALPFISLYKPLSFPLSLALGGLRVLSCGSELLASIQRDDMDQIAYQLVQTSIAVIAVAGTVFAHPVGMLITTAQDIFVELKLLLTNLQEGAYDKAALNCANILNNSLYIALLLNGGLELAVASLAIQVVLGAYHSHQEFKKGNHLEGAAHLVMALIRGNQARVQMDNVPWMSKLKTMIGNVATKTTAKLSFMPAANYADTNNYSVSVETNQVWIEGRDGVHFHTATYPGGVRIETRINGDDIGLQEILCDGEIVAVSRTITWNDDHFVHLYEGARVTSYMNRQVLEACDWALV